MTSGASPMPLAQAVKRASIDGLRICISYAHDNYEHRPQRRCHLKNYGATVLWDRGFARGSGFHEQIKTQIAYAHVFMPLRTRSSGRRGWVHQEIGYAMALNVPVLPVAVGRPPDAMLHHLHAVWFDRAEDVGQLEEALPPEVFLRLVERFDDPSQAIYVAPAPSEAGGEVGKLRRDVAAIFLFGQEAADAAPPAAPRS